MAKEERLESYREIQRIRRERSRNYLRRVTSQKELNKFQDSTMFYIVENEDTEELLTEFFDLFNYISFAGFDYYHYSPVGGMLDENDSLIGISSTIDVLVNKEHLLKLKQVVECFDDLEFISYKGDYGQEFSIWRKGTPCRIDLVPFVRRDGQIVIDSPEVSEDYSEELYANELSHNGIPFKELSVGGEEDTRVERVNVRKVLKR